MNEKHIRTTITLHRNTHKRLRKLAVERGIPLNTLLVEAIRAAYPPPQRKEPKNGQVHHASRSHAPTHHAE